MRKEEDIEFDVQTVEDTPSGVDEKKDPSIVRNIFRVPVSGSYGVCACFAGHKYDVVNLSRKGIAIRLPKGEEPFEIGKSLPAIELMLPDRVLNVRGKVVHVSYDEKECPICGLHFTDQDEDSELRMAEFYEHLRKEMF